MNVLLKALNYSQKPNGTNIFGEEINFGDVDFFIPWVRFVAADIEDSFWRVFEWARDAIAWCESLIC